MHFIIKALFLISLIFSLSFAKNNGGGGNSGGGSSSSTPTTYSCSDTSPYVNDVWFMEVVAVTSGQIKDVYIELEIKDNSFDTNKLNNWKLQSCEKTGSSSADCDIAGVPTVENGNWVIYDGSSKSIVKIASNQTTDFVLLDENNKVVDYLTINETGSSNGDYGKIQFDSDVSCFNHSISALAPTNNSKGVYRGEGNPIITEEGGANNITPNGGDGWYEVGGKGGGANSIYTKGNSNTCNWGVSTAPSDKADIILSVCQDTNTTAPAGKVTWENPNSSTNTTYDDGCEDIKSLSPYLLFDDNISGGLKFIGDSTLTGTGNKNNYTNMTAKATSQATLSLNSGESIKKAYLIWQGYLEGNQTSNFSDSSYYKNTTDLVNSIDNITLNGKNLTAQTTDIHYKHCYHRFDYQAMIDITNEISDKTVSQNFTVSNLNTQSGNVLGGAYGVWSIAFVYENPSQIYKNVTLFHMYDEIYSENSKDITFNGFHTPNATPFEADLFIVAGEGDEGYIGDNVKINNNLLASNAFNSSIYTDSNNRSPEALDIDDYNGTNGIDSKIGANETSSTFTLETNGDRYFPAIVGLATELFVPKLCYSEEVFKDGLKLGSNDVVYLGDELTFNVTVGNIGKDVAESVSVKKPFYTPFEYAQNTSYITGVKKLDSSSEVTYLNPDLSLKLPNINNSSNTNFSYNANIIAYPKDGIIDNNYTATYNGGQYIEINSEKIPQCSNSNIYPQIYVALLDVKYSISSNDDLSDTNKTEVATNNNIIFDINITNLGEVNATETNIVIDLVTGFEFDSVDNPNLTCVDPIQNNQLVCNFNNSYKIYPNQEESIKITLKAPNYEIDFNTSVGGSTLPEGKTRQNIETKESEIGVIKTNKLPTNPEDVNLTTIIEGISDSNNTGDYIYTLVEKSLSTDEDNKTGLGFALYDINNTNGRWEYFNTDSSSWSIIPSNVSITNAILLPHNSKVRFKPNLKYNGFSNFKFKIWDSFEGTNYQTINTETNSSYSLKSANGLIEIKPIVPLPNLEYRFDACSWDSLNNTVLDYQHADDNGVAYSLSTSGGKTCKSADLTANGTDDYIEVPADVMHGLKDFTFSIWVQPTNLDDRQHEIIQGVNSNAGVDEFEFYISNKNGKKQFVIKLKQKAGQDEYYIDIPNGIELNEWYHFMVRRSGDTLSVYVGGVLYGSESGYPTTALNIDSLLIGQEQDRSKANGYKFDKTQDLEGYVDEIKIFDYALSDTEIDSLYLYEMDMVTNRVCPVCLEIRDSDVLDTAGNPTKVSQTQDINLTLTLFTHTTADIIDPTIEIPLPTNAGEHFILSGSVFNDWSCNLDSNYQNILCTKPTGQILDGTELNISLISPNYIDNFVDYTSHMIFDAQNEEEKGERDQIIDFIEDTNLTITAKKITIEKNTDFNYEINITNGGYKTAKSLDLNLSVDSYLLKSNNINDVILNDGIWNCIYKGENIVNCTDGDLPPNGIKNISIPMNSGNLQYIYPTEINVTSSNSLNTKYNGDINVTESGSDLAISNFKVEATHNGKTNSATENESLISDFSSDLNLSFRLENNISIAKDVNITIPLSDDFSSIFSDIDFSIIDNGNINGFDSSDCQIISKNLICELGNLADGYSGDFKFSFKTPSEFNDFDLNIIASASTKDTDETNNEKGPIRIQNLFANSQYSSSLNSIDYIIQGDFVVLDENNKIASLPTGATIKEAKLYWQGSIPNADINSSTKSFKPSFGKVTLNGNNIELNTSDNNLSWITLENGTANGYDLVYQGIYDIKADNINSLKIDSSNSISIPESLSSYQNYSIIIIYENTNSSTIKSVNLRESFIGIDSNTTAVNTHNYLEDSLSYTTKSPISFQGFYANIVDVNDSRFYNISTKDSDFNISIDVNNEKKEDSFNTIFDISENKNGNNYVDSDHSSLPLELNSVTKNAQFKRYYSGATIVSTKLKNPLSYYAVAKPNSKNGNNQYKTVTKHDRVDIEFYLDSIDSSIGNANFENVDVILSTSSTTALEISDTTAGTIKSSGSSLEVNLTNITGEPELTYTLKVLDEFIELNVTKANKILVDFDVISGSAQRYRLKNIKPVERQNDILQYEKLNPIFNIWESSKFDSNNIAGSDKNISTLTSEDSSITDFVVSTDDSTLFDNNRSYKITINVINKSNGDKNLTTLTLLPNGNSIILNEDTRDLTISGSDLISGIDGVYRNLKFNINWNLLDENNNTIDGANGSNENSDGFAIKPSHFTIKLPDYALAGNLVPIDLEALNSLGTKISNYEVNASVYHLKEDILTTGATIVFDYDKTQSFSTGAISNLDSNFTDVGEVNVTINDGWEDYQNLTCNTSSCYDNDGCPFACIDFLSDYSNADSILITSAEDNITIYPYEFNISTGFSDYFSNNGNPWIYMADMIDLNVTFDFNITAKNRQGDITRNFDNTSPIFYEAVNFTLDFTQINVNSDFEYSLNEGVINTNGAFSSIFSSNFNFSAGESNSSLVFNLKRDRTTAISPANLKFNSISPNLSANMRSAGVNNNSDSAIKAENNVSFYYGRVDGKDIEIDVHTVLNPNALVFAEIYLDDKDRDFANIFDSVDIDDYENPNSESFWYQNLAHDISINTPIKSLNWSDDKINLDGSGAGTGISNLNLIDGLSKLPITNTLNSDEFARGVTIYLDVDKYLWFDKYSPYGYSDSNNKNTQPSFDIILRNSNTNRGPGVNQEIKSDVINKRRIDW